MFGLFTVGPFLLQAAGVVPDNVWKDYPLVAIIGALIFYQGRKMDNLSNNIKDLAVAIAQSHGVPLPPKEGR